MLGLTSLAVVDGAVTTLKSALFGGFTAGLKRFVAADQGLGARANAFGAPDASR